MLFKLLSILSVASSSGSVHVVNDQITTTAAEWRVTRNVIINKGARNSEQNRGPVERINFVLEATCHRSTAIFSTRSPPLFFTCSLIA